MYWLQLVVIVALLAAVGWLAIGGGGHMSEPMPDRPDLALPNEGMLERTDVDRVRFSVGARGYRMDEVDDVLDRLAREIELREDRIAELEGRPPRRAVSLEDDEEVAADTESADTGIAAEEQTAAGSETSSEDVAETENVSAESEGGAADPVAAPVQSIPENEGSAE